MVDNYDAAFKLFRDEFRMIKESQPIYQATSMAGMALNWPSPSGMGESGTREPKSSASSSLSASSQHTTPFSTPYSPPITGSINGAIEKETRIADDNDAFDEDQACTEAQSDQVPVVRENSAPLRSRKGHKKSRLGCYNCKRRKIKCQETQPECENCTQKRLKCQYPPPKTLLELQTSSSYAPNPIASVNLQSTPTQFTLTDMRLFHHFLMIAYPHLPVGNDSAWLCQVPLIAHHNEYLMHAILGLAASHLELSTGADLRSVAIQHRIHAIKGSNAAISQTSRSGSDADALLAACYALTFQSAYMSDGLQEFFQMVRGCSLLSTQLRSEKLPMAFFLTEDDHFHYMEDKLLDLPVINSDLVAGAEKSLTALLPLFSDPSHPYFYQLLMAIIDAVKVSSLGAYFKFVSVYQGILKMEPEMFQQFIDPTNYVSRLLIANFLGIHLIVSPITEREWAGRIRTTPVGNRLDWMDMIFKDCPTHLRRYLEWPMAVRICVSDELDGKEAPVPRVSILRKKEGFSKSMC